MDESNYKPGSLRDSVWIPKWVRGLMRWSQDKRVWKNWVNEARQEAARNRAQDPSRGNYLPTVFKVAISPDGAYFAFSGGEWNSIHILETETGRHIWTYGRHREPIDAMAFTPDGKFIAAGDFFFGQIIFYKLGTVGLSSIKVPDDDAENGFLAFSPDGMILANACFGQRIYLFYWRTGESLPYLEINKGEYASTGVSSVAFSFDGLYIAAGTWDSPSHGGMCGSIFLWELKSGRMVRTFTGHHDCITSIAFRPDGGSLASGDRGGVVRLWDWKVGVCTKEIKLRSWTAEIAELAYSSDGKYLAGCGEASMLLCNAQTGDLVHTLHPQMRVNSMAFTPDGKRLLAGGSGVVMWKLSDGDISPRHLLTNTGWSETPPPDAR